jgi:hypothetical protein
MTAGQAIRFIEQHRKVSLHCEELVGYEELSEEVSMDDHSGLIAIVGMILDCDGSRGRPTPYLLVEHSNRDLQVWNIPQPLP